MLPGGFISVGQTVTGCGVFVGNPSCMADNTRIASRLTGTGTTGTYELSLAQPTSASGAELSSFGSVDLIANWASGSSTVTVTGPASGIGFQLHGMNLGDKISGTGLGNAVCIGTFTHAVIVGDLTGTGAAEVTASWTGYTMRVTAVTSGTAPVLLRSYKPRTLERLFFYE